MTAMHVNHKLNMRTTAVKMKRTRHPAASCPEPSPSPTTSPSPSKTHSSMATARSKCHGQPETEADQRAN
ncbi:GM16235 [Drosophila sechellia]|uniref:GM16235 n=1 Tax=Drosophila sechellia TaxID=7238 RepID=B4HXZ0_DROSE|nr:GM16235 [Drosophila sechellia]